MIVLDSMRSLYASTGDERLLYNAIVMPGPAKSNEYCDRAYELTVKPHVVLSLNQPGPAWNGISITAFSIRKGCDMGKVNNSSFVGEYSAFICVLLGYSPVRAIALFSGVEKTRG